MWARLLPLGPIALEPEIGGRVPGARLPMANKRIAAVGHDLILRPYARALAGASAPAARGSAMRAGGGLGPISAFDRGEPRSALTSTIRAIVLRAGARELSAPAAAVDAG